MKKNALAVCITYANHACFVLASFIASGPSDAFCCEDDGRLVFPAFAYGRSRVGFS